MQCWTQLYIGGVWNQAVLLVKDYVSTFATVNPPKHWSKSEEWNNTHTTTQYWVRNQRFAPKPSAMDRLDHTSSQEIILEVVGVV